MEPVTAKSSWVITTFFNPQKYKNKRRNFLVFRKNLKRQGIPCAVIECTFGGRHFELQDNDADIIIRVKSSSVLWQKERLLTILKDRLPSECRNVIWVDADILFLDDNWYANTLRLLETYPVVQPFSHALRFEKGDKPRMIPSLLASGARGLSESFAYSVRDHQDKVPDYTTEGGFAWAARREIFDGCGFYDKSIIGGGDWVMNTAFFGMAVQYPLSEKWIETVKPRVAGKVTFCPGTVVHLFHGSKKDRKYETRGNILRDGHYNPAVDLCLNEYGCFEWTGQNKELEKMVWDYFMSRNEEARVFAQRVDMLIGKIGQMIKRVSPALYRFLKSFM